MKYKTKNGLIVEVRVKLLDDITKYQHSKVTRNGWCQHIKPCSKYNCRPCCPPKVPLFSELPKKDFMYVTFVKIYQSDYFTTYPKVQQHKSSKFLSMIGCQYKSCSVSNHIVNSMKGQGFRVSSCLGCQFPKTGICKRFMPTLEGVGINVCALSEEVFDEEIVWDVSKTIAIGGLYTDERIKKQVFADTIRRYFDK